MRARQPGTGAGTTRVRFIGSALWWGWQQAFPYTLEVTSVWAVHAGQGSVKGGTVSWHGLLLILPGLEKFL